MGYFTYRIFRHVSVQRLARQVKANLHLYAPGTIGRKTEVTVIQGTGCSAILLWYPVEHLLLPVGYQLGCLWMDVRYQDGDWWDLTISKGIEHQVSHSVNPWAYGEKYNQEQVDYRIAKVCKLWPDMARYIRRYLLPWREPVTKSGKQVFVRRKGKAYPHDEYEYGSADQIHDFVAAFGITSKAKSERVRAG